MWSPTAVKPAKTSNPVSLPNWISPLRCLSEQTLREKWTKLGVWVVESALDGDEVPLLYHFSLLSLQALLAHALVNTPRDLPLNPGSLHGDYNSIGKVFVTSLLQCQGSLLVPLLSAFCLAMWQFCFHISSGCPDWMGPDPVWTSHKCHPTSHNPSMPTGGDGGWTRRRVAVEPTGLCYYFICSAYHADG